MNSPCFLDFLGSLNPFQQIREYLKDRHERKKDNCYRNRQEEINGELDILESKNNIIIQRIDIFKSLGYSDIEIKSLAATFILSISTDLNTTDK
jgi:hypothetical protein